MDVGLHQLAKCGIDRAMACQRGEPFKFRADYADTEMPPAIAGTRVADVTVTVIGDCELAWMQNFFESRADCFNPVDHGKTLRKGLTSTSR